MSKAVAPLLMLEKFGMIKKKIWKSMERPLIEIF